MSGDRPYDPSFVDDSIPEDQGHFRRYRTAAAPVISDLREAGLPVDIIEDLYHKRLPYQHALPILLKWLPLVENASVKEAMVRALSVRWAKGIAAGPLIEQFLRPELVADPSPSNASLKWAIGNALSVVATKTDYDSIAAIVRDKRHGAARQMPVLWLGTLRNRPEVVALLISLLNDEDVAGHAVSSLRKLGDPSALPYLQCFCEHPVAWIRRDARAAVAGTRGRSRSAD